MPLASRHFLPGQLWHITHRCHEKSFLLKLARDRLAQASARRACGARVIANVIQHDKPAMPESATLAA